MTLYINACVRPESRTDRLARELLATLGDYEELNLEKEGLRPLDRKTLEKRTALLAAGDYSHPMLAPARQLAAADCVVIAAPYWDLSFPAALKTYIENIYAIGIVTAYNPDGTPVGLCRATDLYYVTTAGGRYDRRYSYDYITTLAQKYFGIKECHLVYAEMLDIEGYDAEEILKNGVKRI